MPSTINNFAAGVIPNAAYTRFRDIAARDALNVRVDENGYLQPRKGLIQLTEDDVDSVFHYKGLVFAFIGDQLKWARAPHPVTAINFMEFSNNIQHGELEDDEGWLTWIGHDDTIFVSTGSRTWVIDVRDTSSPALNNFYLKNAGYANLYNIS